MVCGRFETQLFRHLSGWNYIGPGNFGCGEFMWASSGEAAVAGVPVVGSAAVCVELKSLKLYFHAFRNEGMFFEAVTNRSRDDRAGTASAVWMQVVSDGKGRGGVKSRVIAPWGDVPPEFRAG